jgi:hypothetical protein
MIKSRRIQLVGHIERIGDVRNVCAVLSKNLQVRYILVDLDSDREVILKCHMILSEVFVLSVILRTNNGMAIGLIGLYP